MLTSWLSFPPSSKGVFLFRLNARAHVMTGNHKCHPAERWDSFRLGHKHELIITLKQFLLTKDIKQLQESITKSYN